MASENSGNRGPVNFPGERREAPCSTGKSSIAIPRPFVSRPLRALRRPRPRNSSRRPWRVMSARLLLSAAFCVGVRGSPRRSPNWVVCFNPFQGFGGVSAPFALSRFWTGVKSRFPRITTTNPILPHHVPPVNGQKIASKPLPISLARIAKASTTTAIRACPERELFTCQRSSSFQPTKIASSGKSSVLPMRSTFLRHASQSK